MTTFALSISQMILDLLQFDILSFFRNQIMAKLLY